MPGEPEAQARFWVARNVSRWQQGIERERRDGLVVPTLRARRDADTTRTRRGFERHVRPRESVLRWYLAIDELDPGRVRFGLPETGLTPDLLAIGLRRVRSGAALFERLLAQLR